MFIRSLNPMIEAKEDIEYIKNILPEFNGCETMLNALDQANYWIGFAIECWGLQGINIIEYNKKEWLEGIQELKR